VFFSGSTPTGSVIGGQTALPSQPPAYGK
jgi:hypothetical protein